MTQTSVPMTAGAADTTLPKAIFGVVLVFNGVEVPISGSIGDIKKNGFKFDLPQPVNIGSPGDLLSWIDKTFNTTIGDTLKKAETDGTLPDPIAQLVGNVLTVDITVTRASINVPPKKTPPDPAEHAIYTIEVSAAFSDGVDLIPGVDALKLKGLVAGATNDPGFIG